MHFIICQIIKRIAAMLEVRKGSIPWHIEVNEVQLSMLLMFLALHKNRHDFLNT